METDDTRGRALRHLNLLLLACLLVASTVLVIRLAGLVGETHKTLVGMSQDLKAVATAAGNISRDVETLRAQVHDLQERVSEVIPDESVSKAWEDAKLIKEGLTAGATALSDESEAEIEQLLAALSASTYKYRNNGKISSISRLHRRVYPKYLSMRKTLASAEDFIAKVGSQTMLGKDYVIVDTNGVSMKLGDWFSRELKGIRRAQQ